MVVNELRGFTVEKCIKKLLLLCSHPYFSCLGPGSLGGEWWFLSMASHRRMEVLCATLGVGCGLGGIKHHLRAMAWGSAAPPTWAQEMSQGCDLGRLRRDLLVAQICWWLRSAETVSAIWIAQSQNYCSKCHGSEGLIERFFLWWVTGFWITWASLGWDPGPQITHGHTSLHRDSQCRGPTSIWDSVW